MYSPVKLWRNQKQVRSLLGMEGTVVSWTLIHVPPEGFHTQAPYPVAVVVLTGGMRIPVQMVDWQKKHCRVGQKVRIVLRKITDLTAESVIPYGAKAKPI